MTLSKLRSKALRCTGTLSLTTYISEETQLHGNIPYLSQKVITRQ